MGLELIKATVINIYKTLAITGYPLSWPSKLIMSATQHSLFCTLGPSGSPYGEGSAPAVTTLRALRQLPTPVVITEGAGSCTLFSGQLDSHNKGRFSRNKCTRPSNPKQGSHLGNVELPWVQELRGQPVLSPQCPFYLPTARGFFPEWKQVRRGLQKIQTAQQ